MPAPDQIDHSPAPTHEDRLRASLAWHFRCHADEPQKSYAALGIANAELIVARMIVEARAAALREAADEFDAMWNRGHDNSVHPNSHLLRERADRIGGE